MITRHSYLYFLFASLLSLSAADTLKSFSSQEPELFNHYELRVLDTEDAKRYDKVLLFITDDVENIDSIAENEKWQNFAKEQKVGFAVLSCDIKTENRRSYLKSWQTDTKGSVKKLFKGINSHLDEVLPNIRSYGFIGYEGKSDLPAILMSYYRTKCLFWVLPNNDWLAPKDLKRSAPGLIISNDDRISSRVLDSFQQNRAKNLPLMLLNDWGRDYDEEVLESFIEAMLQRNSSKGILKNIWDMKTVNQVRNKESLKDTSWIPSEAVAQKWEEFHELTDDEKLKEIISETVKVDSVSQPRITFHMRVPPNLKSPADASGALCIITWMGKAQDAINLVKHEGGFPRLQKWADENDLIVMTWTTKKNWVTGADQDTLEEDTAVRLSDNFDEIADSWEKGLSKIIKKYSIPSERLLLFGFSQGANWGNRIVLRKPERFLATHLHVAGTYDIPQKRAKDVLWLITTGESDGAYDDSFRFYSKCRELGYPMVIKAEKSLGHGYSKYTGEFSEKFFEYALKVKDVSETQNIPSAQLMRKHLDSSKWVGDFINQEVHKKADSDWIPKEQVVLLPTEEIAELWAEK